MSGPVLRPLSRKQVRRVYRWELSAAFPRAERRPLWSILRMMDDGVYDALGCWRGDELLGYALLWRGADFVLLDYLGVSARLRNGGLGSELLARLAQRYGKQGLILESETPVPGGDPSENNIRRRRIAFYERNGFTTVYEMATCGLRWNAMLWGPVPDGLDAVMAAHRALYGPSRTDVRVPLGPDEVPQLPYWMKEKS